MRGTARLLPVSELFRQAIVDRESGVARSGERHGADDASVDETDARTVSCGG